MGSMALSRSAGDYFALRNADGMQGWTNWGPVNPLSDIVDVLDGKLRP
jgi:hypothetical protein